MKVKFLQNDLINKQGGLIFSLSAFILYWFTRSNHYTAASLEFSAEIESGNLASMLHIHKMLIHPIGWLFFNFWKFLGWNGNSLYPSQILNGICGALSVGLIFITVRYMVKSNWISCCITAGCAVSCGMWLFSTEAEFVTPAILVILFIFWRTFKYLCEARMYIHSFKLGILTGLSIVIYITNVFFIPAHIIAIILSTKEEGKNKWNHMILYGIGLLLVILPIFASVLYFVYGVQNFESLQHFNLYGGSGAGVGSLYGRVDLLNFLYGSYALLRSFTTFPGLGLDDSTANLLKSMISFERLVFIVFNFFIFIIFSYPFILALKLRNHLLTISRTPLIFLITWSLGSAFFAFYWVPKDMQFWIPVSLAWWFLLGLVIRSDAFLIKKFNNRKNKVFLIHNNVWLMISIPIILFLINGIGVVIPHRNLETNKDYWIAMSVKEHTQQGDLIISDNPYIKYFSGRLSYSIFENLIVSQSQPQKVFSYLEQFIKKISEDGGHIYIEKIPDKAVTEQVIRDLSIISEKEMKQYKTKIAWHEYETQFLEIIR